MVTQSLSNTGRAPLRAHLEDSRKTDVCQRARAVRRDSGAGPVEGVPRELWVRVALAVNWSPVQVHGGKAFIHDSNLVTSHPHGGPWREALEETMTV